MPQQKRTVSVLKVQTEDIAYKSRLPGRARAYLEAEIRPQVTGLIEKRLFTQGEEVKAGQALYQIDKAEYAAAYASAKASLQRAEAADEAAGLIVKRYEGLVAKNAISEQDFDDAVTAQKKSAADVALARAALQTAGINLSRTTVNSPISGRIGRSSVTPGALVTQNQATALAHVVQLDPIYVDLTVSSSQMLQYRRDVTSGLISTDESGQAGVSIVYEDGELYPHKGQLEFSEVSVNETEGSVAIRAIVPNPDGLLLPGMFVHAELQSGAYPGAFLIPQAVVSRTPKGLAVVYVVDGGVVVERPITIARASGSSWIVTDGLNAGDQVIVSGLQTLRAGTPVNPVEADADTIASLMPGKT